MKGKDEIDDKQVTINGTMTTCPLTVTGMCVLARAANPRCNCFGAEKHNRNKDSFSRCPFLLSGEATPMGVHASCSMHTTCTHTETRLAQLQVVPASAPSRHGKSRTACIRGPSRASFGSWSPSPLDSLGYQAPRTSPPWGPLIAAGRPRARGGQLPPRQSCRQSGGYTFCLKR